MAKEKTYEEAYRQHVSELLMPLSAQISSNAQTADTTALPEGHDRHSKAWVEGLQQLENSYVPQGVAAPREIPVIAPVIVNQTLSNFMQQSMAYLSSAASVFKAYIQMYGADEAALVKFKDGMIATVQGMCAVSIDAMYASLNMRADKQTKDKAPALQSWNERHKQMVSIWQQVIGDDPDPEKMAEYAIRFQAELVKFARKVRPDLIKDEAVTEEQLEQFSQQTGIPVDKLRAMLAGDEPEATPANPGEESDPESSPASEQSDAKEDQVAPDPGNA